MLTTADMGLGGTAPTTMKTQQVKVIRAFIWQGKPTKVGEVIDLPAPFAAEMSSYNKVIRVDAPVPAEPAASDAGASKPARGRQKE